MTRIEFVGNDIEIDAQVLATAFAIGEDDLKRAMRDGTITSRVERGEGDDAGRYRLNFFSADRRVRIVADASGQVPVFATRREIPARPLEITITKGRHAGLCGFRRC